MKMLNLSVVALHGTIVRTCEKAIFLNLCTGRSKVMWLNEQIARRARIQSRRTKPLEDWGHYIGVLRDSLKRLPLESFRKFCEDVESAKETVILYRLIARD